MSAFTEANRKAFNDLSDTYNSHPWQRELSNQVVEALRARKDWFGVDWLDAKKTLDEQSVSLLDYACGTGAVTKALGAYVTTIRGIDISERMVEKYNEAAQSSGLTQEQAHAVVGDLCATTVPEHLNGPDLQSFDIAVICAGFHHFEDPALAVKRLTERLKPATGVLVIVDFLPSSAASPHADGKEVDFPDMAHTIKHNGFTGEQMRDFYQNAGLVDFDVVALSKPAVMELKHGRVERTLFIAKGKRAPSTWQKLSSWVGGVQSAAAGQLSYGKDSQAWNQGLKQDERWSPGTSQDGKSWDGVNPAAQKPSKPWSGM